MDSRRASGFLLGLVVVLSLFLVALEFTTQSGPVEADGDVLDDVSQDIELMPAVRRNDMVAAAPGRRSSAVAGKINIVDNASAGTTDNAPAPDSNVLSALAGTALGGVTDIPVTEIRPVSAADSDNPLNFQVVERLPEFPGGMSEFVQWLTKNLRYPVTAQRNRKEGTVLVSFIINKDGSVTDQKVVKSAAPELDREALRVIKMMPKWKPGEDRGKPCRTYFCIPVVFKL